VWGGQITALYDPVTASELDCTGCVLMATSSVCSIESQSKGHVVLTLPGRPLHRRCTQACVHLSAHATLHASLCALKCSRNASPHVHPPLIAGPSPPRSGRPSPSRQSWRTRSGSRCTVGRVRVVPLRLCRLCAPSPALLDTLCFVRQPSPARACACWH